MFPIKEIFKAENYVYVQASFSSYSSNRSVLVAYPVFTILVCFRKIELNSLVSYCKLGRNETSAFFERSNILWQRKGASNCFFFFKSMLITRHLH